MTLNRREFVGLIGAAAVGAAADQPHSLILIDSDDAARMRDFARRDRTALADNLDKLAAAALGAGPWSVTYHRPAGLNVNAGPEIFNQLTSSRKFPNEIFTGSPSSMEPIEKMVGRQF